MNRFKLVLAFCLSLVFAGLPVFAAEESELETLREQLEKMNRLVNVQRKALLNLEKRLRALEAGPAPEGAAPREAPVQPGVPVPPKATPPEPGVAAPKKEAAEEEPVKKEAPPSRAMETVAQEEHTLFGRRFTLEPSITYSRFDRATINLSGFLALDAIFLGNISVDEVESDVVTFDLTGRYGITDRLQVDLNAPFVYRLSNFQSGGAGGSATAQIEADVDAKNLGDIGIGFSYRVFAETETWPDVVWNVGARAPTGKHPFGIELVEVPGSQGNLSVPEDLPTGSGVWQGSTGFSVLKTIDPAILFASIGYSHNFERSFDDIGSASGDQPGDVDLGDSIQFGLGVAYALNERLSLSLSYTQLFGGEAETRLTGQEWQEVIGSDAAVGILNTGFTYALTDNLTMVTNIGAGLTEDAADVEFTIRFPYNF